MMQLSEVFLFFLITIVAASDKECGIQPSSCNNNIKFRTIDGTCNNKNNPVWGSSTSTYARIVPPKYGDGIHSLPLTTKGQPLPNARQLTVSIYTDGYVDKCEEITLSAMTFGQAIAHDLGSTTTPLVDNCCTQFYRHPPSDPKECANIDVLADDPYYSFINATCLPLFRSLTNKNTGCQDSLKYEEQLNAVTSYLDLSIVYGRNDEQHKTLRSFKNGMLLVDVRDNHEWPVNAPRDVCPGLLKYETKCYRTGDARTIQNPQLTVAHILFIREHNRVAKELAKINPKWNDETLFQVARSICIAQWQHIAYYELLPLYAGYDNLIKNKVLFNTNADEYVNNYDTNQRPITFQEFSHGAFRQFHSLIAGKIGLFNSAGCRYDDLVLRDHVERPVALEKADVFDGIIRGWTLQPQMPSDIYYDADFTREMFLRSPRFGQDIKAKDLQRSRDHGVASYNDLRQYCGLPKAKNFTQFLDVMTKDKLNLLTQFYQDPDDVDLLVGGGMETNVKGTLAGPTFLCIMYRQFRVTRKSDRFWFEHPTSGFTREQLKEIRKATISKFFCDNGNNITHMQKKGFLQVSSSNPKFPCNQLQGPNLKLWNKI